MTVGKNASDDDLIRACQQGYADAGVMLVDRYWDRVYAFALRLSLNQSDAEDIAQETFLRVFEKISEYKPEGQFKAWALRIAANLFLDAKRAARTRDVSPDETNEHAEPGVGPEQATEQRELMDALTEALRTLSREQCAVVMLRAVEQLDYREIADMLSMKEGTVRWHMYEARRILREKLSRKFSLEALSNG